MKIIAYYLPQYHEIPENNEWWGNGFTEWTTLRKAKPLFEGHYQPRLPLNNNYYNLLDKNTYEWQVDIAKKHGIYGFCFYHYWFNGKKLLEKPIEMILKNSDLDYPFCICWANENWTRAWESKSNQILIAQKYGDTEDWKNHFYYLLDFFRDSRYIKEDGFPLLVIYRPNIIDKLNEMLDYWTKLAVDNGLPGIKYAYQAFQENLDDSRFTYDIEYQPNYARSYMNRDKHKFIRKIKRKLTKIMLRFNVNLENTRLPGLVRENYEDIWKTIISRKPLNSKSIPGAFVDWDNTPRRSEKGSLMIGANPETFKVYFKKQLINSIENYNNDYLFIFAWNEWTEGGYLEPDARYNYSYLEKIKESLIELNIIAHESKKHEEI